MKIPRRDFRNCALLAVLCVLAYLPAIAGLLAGDWPIVDDGITLFNIWHELANRGLKNGVVPLWNPYLFCGLPLFANNQSAILYPPNLLYLIVPMPLALVLDAIFHNVLLAVGAYVLGRAMHLSRTASFAMAVTFSLAGGVAAHIYNGHMTWHAVRAFLPWELAFLLLYLRGGKKQFVVLLGVCFALQVAAGYPPLVLVSAALCIGLVCAWLVAGRRLPQGWLGAAMLVWFVSRNAQFDLHFATGRNEPPLGAWRCLRLRSRRRIVRLVEIVGALIRSGILRQQH